MPSLQQINTTQPSEMPKQPKNAALKKYLKIIAGVAAIWLGYTYFTGAKVMTIPDDAYAMRDKSMFKELFESPYKKIIWFGADCPISRQKSSIINTVLQVTQLNKFYVHRPFLQNSLFVQPTDLLGAYIMKNCSGHICIIVPASHKVIQTKEKYLGRDLSKYKNYQ